VLAKKRVITFDRRRITGFVHNSAEVRQQIRYLKGEIAYPPHLHKVIGQFLGDPRCEMAHVPPHRYVVEISSAKRYVSEGIDLQINLLFRALEKILGSVATRTAFLGTIALEDPQAREAMIESTGRTFEPGDLRLLRTLEEHRQSPDELAADLAAIKYELDAPFLLVTHVGVALPNGAPILSREKLMADVRKIGAALGLDVFDPTDDMKRFGQERAMAKGGTDSAHFTAEFNEHLAAVYAGKLAVEPRALRRLRGSAQPTGFERMVDAGRAALETAQSRVQAGGAGLARRLSAFRVLRRRRQREKTESV
jgi:hypothetical protein